MAKALKCCTVGSVEDKEPKHLLHGVLEIFIDELKLGTLTSSLWADINDYRGGCHVTVHLPPVKIGKTTAQQSHKGRVVWQETLRTYCANKVSEVVFSMKGHGYKGKARVLASEILEKRHIDGWYSVDGNFKNHGKLRIVLDFFPVNEDPLWCKGVGDPKAFQGVPNTFFPMHKGCRVTPYQNSHIEDDFSPPIFLAGGKPYKPGKCWQELHQHILEAKKFIYIAGWSMYAEIALVRGAGGEWISESLRTLLTRKAEEGVSVLVMIWDDKTNNLDGLISKQGMMHTHDEDTHKSFMNTKVNVFQCPRDPKNGAFHLVDGFVFTHHQKAVVLDAPDVDPNSSRRRLVAFVGGIDLCGGRYDTPTHSLFRTLNTVHSRDFHQESLPGAKLEEGGPRQPWHDIHSKLGGAVAWDVYTNFARRWTCQNGAESKLLVNVYDETVFCPPSPVVSEGDPSSWNAQLFRSIDSSSVDFPTDPEKVLKKGLIRKSSHVVDRSIQDAYICAIRRAKRFIFIENQYFMGSSFAWRDDPTWERNIPNLIPVEIALKIANQIRAGERFSAYIIIPMTPNGPPSSTSVQDLLHHQRKTMEMMYSIITEALVDKGRFGEHPTDYLRFFCLGNREAKTDSEYVPPESPPNGSHYEKAQENRRFPIYVHAKLLIVDDEYLIIGSANINQRAMDGARDTEMAVGAFQPFFTLYNALDKDTPSGEVYAFRMSLWYEHLGLLDPVFEKPWELECMKKVQKLAAENFVDYIKPGPPTDLKRHLLPYPVKVSRDGLKLYTEPGDEHYPDTDASILGTDNPCLPAMLTA
ncbi:unnamed protein product [Calypogeia fissa]